MATTKPRLTITLEPHTHTVITELARLQGRSKAKIITELLDSVVPVLERTCYVLQLAQSATLTVTDDLKASMERSEATLREMFADALGQMDIFADQLSESTSEGADEGIGEERSSRHDVAEPGTLPPHSNTGVTIGDKSRNPKKNKH